MSPARHHREASTALGSNATQTAKVHSHSTACPPGHGLLFLESVRTLLRSISLPEASLPSKRQSPHPRCSDIKRPRLGSCPCLSSVTDDNSFSFPLLSFPFPPSVPLSYPTVLLPIPLYATQQCLAAVERGGGGGRGAEAGLCRSSQTVCSIPCLQLPQESTKMPPVDDAAYRRGWLSKGGRSSTKNHDSPKGPQKLVNLQRSRPQPQLAKAFQRNHGRASCPSRPESPSESSVLARPDLSVPVSTFLSQSSLRRSTPRGPTAGREFKKNKNKRQASPSFRQV